jgi:hypothetical protein
MALVLLGSFAQIMEFALSGGPVEDSWIASAYGALRRIGAYSTATQA